MSLINNLSVINNMNVIYNLSVINNLSAINNLSVIKNRSVINNISVINNMNARLSRHPPYFYRLSHQFLQQDIYYAIIVHVSADRYSKTDIVHSLYLSILTKDIDFAQ